MKSIVLAVLLVMLPIGRSTAVLHPALEDPRISQCSLFPPPGYPKCGYDVWYKSNGTYLQDLTPAVPPIPDGSLELIALGMHCLIGDGPTGKPFSRCNFSTSQHAPTLSNCKLISTDSWELTRTSTCNTTTRWGPHNGAGPGGECVLFVQRPRGSIDQNTAHTIHGVLTPDLVANSGSVFCQKPLPPDVDCSVLMPDVIDHQTIPPTATSQVSVVGTVSCGMNPVVTILTGEKVTLAPGINVKLRAELEGSSRLRLTSDLTSVAAAPGPYSASIVVSVSPY